METDATRSLQSRIDPVAQPIPLPFPFHLFFSRRDAGIQCAIRQDRGMPSFLNGETWVFSRIVKTEGQAPLDFNVKAAQASVHLTGYHLFTALRDAGT